MSSYSPASGNKIVHVYDAVVLKLDFECFEHWIAFL